MVLYYDLHIHSALSPCASEEMTPNNIVNMAIIKGLDVIAVTDHNATYNLKAIESIAKKEGLLFIPGIEVESCEGVHLLCYFPRVDLAEAFGEIITQSLPAIKTNKVFGQQLIVDEEDEIVARFEKLLINSSQFTIEEIWKYTQNYQGVMVYAHIFRGSNGVLPVLGFLPKNIRLNALEIYAQDIHREEIKRLEKEYTLLVDSDAHQLVDIHEREYALEVQNKTVEAILNRLKMGLGDCV